MENFLDSVKQAMDSAVKKTSEMVEKTKIKLALVDMKNNLKATYTHLGELAYRAAHGDETVNDEIEKTVVIIDQLKASLEQQGAMGTEKTDQKICPACGACCTSEAVFCSSCGKQF